MADEALARRNGEYMETQTTDAATTQVVESPLEGYVPFPDVLRTKDHLQSSFTKGEATERTAKRLAVLVIHGIGAQKPYETLDQFTRGLLGFFRITPAAKTKQFSNPPTQEIRLRQHKANLNTNEKDWTQAFVRVRPGCYSTDVIDVYEYYWAPVITDRVSALQSLKFLIAAGLSPFQYLRDNLTVINRAHSGASNANKCLWLIFALCREIYRMLFIFIPVILLSLGVYWLLTNSAANFLPSKGGILGYLLLKPPLEISQAVHLAVSAVRFLLIGMCAMFLFQEFFSGAQGNPSEQSPPIYTGFITALLVALLVVPYLLRERLDVVQMTKYFLNLPLRTQALYFGGFLLVLVGASFSSKIFRFAWKRAGAALMRHGVLTSAAVLTATGLITVFSATNLKPSMGDVVKVLELPPFLNWRHVIVYILLALFIFVGRRILTSAIGCLAVYLGSDDLSKNFAARSQILHECTTMLIDLLAGQDETGVPNEEWKYEHVLVAGHSLGSVIAYDSLSDLIVRDFAKDPTLASVPLEKVRGLLTFGCPLNKVFYFFRARTNLRTNVLSQILYTLHSFRLRAPLPPEANPMISVPHPFPQKIPFSPKFRWYNAYSPFDIISGRMQFYKADMDVPVERGVTPWTAHLSYWENDDLYSLFSDLIYPRPLTEQ